MQEIVLTNRSKLDGHELALEAMKAGHSEAQLILREGQKRTTATLRSHTEQIARLQGLGDGLSTGASKTEFEGLRNKMSQVQGKLDQVVEVADGLNQAMTAIRADVQGMQDRQAAEIEGHTAAHDELGRENQNWGKMIDMRIEPLDEGDNNPNLTEDSDPLYQPTVP